jgi:phage host-nuclease inhibitor protein Gam
MIIPAAMQDPSKLDRTRRRAEKLQREATNCLSLAVTERSTEFAADLIEEASMLMRRVSELCEA